MTEGHSPYSAAQFQARHTAIFEAPANTNRQVP